MQHLLFRLWASELLFAVDGDARIQRAHTSRIPGPASADTLHLAEQLIDADAPGLAILAAQLHIEHVARHHARDPSSASGSQDAYWPATAALLATLTNGARPRSEAPTLADHLHRCADIAAGQGRWTRDEAVRSLETAVSVTELLDALDHLAPR